MGLRVERYALPGMQRIRMQRMILNSSLESALLFIKSKFLWNKNVELEAKYYMGVTEKRHNVVISYAM